MSQWITKQFKNNATTPIIIEVGALADGLPFAPTKLDDKITQIVATGGTVTFADEARAESHRMRRWVENHFIGKTAAEFYAHNGIVPSAEDMDEQHAASKRVELPQPRTIVNTINVDFFDPPKGVEEFIRKHVDPRRKPEPEANEFDDSVILRAIAKSLDIDIDIDDFRAEMKKGSEVAKSAPQLGTIWQDRNRILRHFRVVEIRPCSGHAHVRMERIDGERGGVYDFPYHDNAQWEKQFKQSREEDVPNVSFKPARERKVGMPPELGMGYGLNSTDEDRRYTVIDESTPFRAARETLLEDWLTGIGGVPSYMQQFLDAVSMEGKELPPAVGERYYSYISDQTYTVVDVRRKLHETDHYVTMERDGDKHRAKFTFRDHAHWLAVWRPLDHEGKPRKTVEVELKVDAADAIRQVDEALRQVGEAAHGAAEAILDYRETDAERQLRILYNELERRRPGWRNMGFHFEHIDELGLAIRAIRALAREGKEVEALKEQNKAQLAMTEVRNKELGKLKLQLAELRREFSQSWGKERIVTEQERMREMLLQFGILFKRVFGMHQMRKHVNAFGAQTFRDMPLEQFVALMKDCNAFAEKQS